MATINILRLSGGRCLSRALGSRFLQPTAPGARALVPKQTLMLTSAAQAREYGPVQGLPSKTTHWKQERVVAVSLLGIIPVGLAFPHPVLNYFLAAGLVLHSHWGLNGVISDYMHGPTLPRVMHGLLYVLSIAAFAGLCNLNYNDIGFGEAVRLLFTKL